MDTALLSSGRMGLSEADAYERIRMICSHVLAAGGVFTVNWHHRSVGPERFWDDLYIRMVEELKKNGAFFATARDAVSWFRKRRSVAFHEVEGQDGKVRIRLEGPPSTDVPGLVLRVHRPTRAQDSKLACGGKQEETTVDREVDTIVDVRAAAAGSRQ